jgi:hypothetical protein
MLVTNRSNIAITLVVLICCLTGLRGMDEPVRTKVAQGSYLKKGPSGSERLDRWVLWRKADHTYQLSSVLFPDAGKSTGATLEQLTDFDSDLKMQRFVLQGRNKEMQNGSVSCELEPKRLTCRADIGGESSSGSTAVEGPYIVAPVQLGEDNDVPWIETSLLRLAKRDAGAPTGVMYIIFWPGKDFEFEQLLDVEIRYLGKESTDVMGRKVTAHRYTEMPERGTAWTAENGVVLAYEQPGKDGYRVELVDFKQYEDFVPELK